MTDITSVTEAAVFAASAICWVYWQRQARAARSGAVFLQKSPTTAVLHLLYEEQQRLIKFPPASSITFYRGALPTEYLAGRIKVILILNPFLTSRLRKMSLFSKEVVATYDSNPDEWCLADYFHVVRDQFISHDMPYQELMNRVGDKYQTKVGTKCVNQDEEVLFKITLIQMEGDSYAVVASLNHSLGDGHTFYKLWGMLSTAATPYSLDPVRKQDFQAEVETLLDPQFMALLKHPFVVIGFLYNRFLHSPLRPHVCVVNKDWVEKVKATFQQQLHDSTAPTDSNSSSAQFLSTNDILTSWFAQFSHCTNMGMIVNFRNRLAGYTDVMAGNYARSAILCAADASRPELIRQGLLGSPPRLRGQSSATQQVAHARDLLTLNFAGVTNWASFYAEVCLPGGHAALHLPVISMAHIGSRSCLVVFKCNKEDTAVVIWSGSISRQEIANEHIISHIL
jgi:hypothetical protein